MILHHTDLELVLFQTRRVLTLDKIGENLYDVPLQTPGSL